MNQEITKQHKLGRKGLPPLQPPGSLDGFEMFGFSSPAIVQVIFADQNSFIMQSASLEFDIGRKKILFQILFLATSLEQVSSNYAYS